MTKLLTNNSRLNSAEQVLESITEAANTAYYLFVGDHYTHANSDLQPVTDNEKMITYDTYHNMIFGKRVEEADVKLMIRNVPYVSNTRYHMYDDQDTTLLTKDFFVVVNATSFYHVYKCLDNNGNTVSTIEPDISHITGSNTYVYQTSDGYRWKYMYSVDSANNLKFSTADYFPVIANSTVVQNSIDGAIDVIKVDGAGKGYDNYLTGTFDSDDIRVDGNSVIYGISNTIGSAVNGFYTDTVLYLSTGTGSGQYQDVVNSFANDTGKYVVVEEEFPTSPTNGTEFEIYPKVSITGSGSEGNTAVARALVNSVASNAVYRVELFNRGNGYNYATANVLANSVVGVEETAIVRPILSPYHGHGYDAARELGSKHLSYSIKVSNSESNTIVVNNQIQQIGILKDPLFSNVLIEIQSSNGTFASDEQVYKADPVRINTNVTINTTSAVVTCSGGDFENQVSAGDWIYFNSSNGTSHQLAIVNSVTNSSSLNLNSNGFFACTETMMYSANVSAVGYIIESNTTHISMANVTGIIAANDELFGVSSGAKFVANTISRAGVEKGFETFVQLNKYIGTVSSGSFTENEIVYQGNLTTSNAFLYSANVDGGILTMYTSNQIGSFVVNASQDIVGNTSGAIADITSYYEPELVFGSGEVLFLENIEPVNRSANTNETFQIIIEF